MNYLLNQKQFIDVVKGIYGVAKARELHQKAYGITCERKPAFKECNPKYHGKHIAIPIDILAECIGLSEERFKQSIEKANSDLTSTTQTNT